MRCRVYNAINQDSIIHAMVRTNCDAANRQQLDALLMKTEIRIHGKITFDSYGDWSPTPLIFIISLLVWIQATNKAIKGSQCMLFGQRLRVMVKENNEVAQLISNGIIREAETRISELRLYI